MINYTLKRVDTQHQKMTPIHQRICSFCQSNEIEDEKHVLFSCSFYDKIRLELNNKINIKYPYFNSFDHNSKIIFLFNNVDPFVCRLTSSFVSQTLHFRQEALIKKK